MNFNDYKTQAKRTLVQLANERDDMLHMAMGVSTEIAELLDIIKKNFAYGKPIDLVHVSEELGDVYWYLANACNIAGIRPTISKTLKYNEGLFIAHTLHDAYQFYDIAQNYTNDKSCVKEIKEVIDWLIIRIEAIINHFGLDRSKILEKNINKLKTRYPDKFTQEKALNRDLTKERLILEK